MHIHHAAIIRWCVLLASTASTPEEAARWRELARRYSSPTT